MTIVWLLVISLAGLVGIVLTILTLPGVWVTLAVALICQLIAGGDPPLFSWWTLAAAFALAIAGEIIELIASAIGAARYGGGKSGAIGSIIGSTVGAIFGTFLIPIPIVGTIAGGVIGAALGAVMAERGCGGRSWGQSCRVGQGAAIGRLLSTVAKLAVAVAVTILLMIAILV
jgi:uncharacterized protein